MKIFRSLLTATLLSGLFLLSAQAAVFESDITIGFLKQNSILTEHFRIEFSNLVMNQPDSDGDGIADVIENVAEYAELSWEVIIEDLNYDSPIAGNNRVVIVLDDRNTYLIPGSVGVTTALSDAVTPLIAIDPWQTADIHKVTIAHEMYHAVQFGYDAGFASSYNSINFAEATAVWVEDLVFDSVNDYYLYLQDFFDYPDYSVFAGISPEGALFPYALTVWPQFLSEYYDDDVIQDIWFEYFDSDLSNSNNSKVFDAVSQIVNERGDNLVEVYREFTYWNLDTTQYAEGSHYPEVFLVEDSVLGEYTLIGDDYAPALYGTNYHYFDNSDNFDDFHFHVIAGDEVGYIVTIIPQDGNNIEFDNALTTLVEPGEPMLQELLLEGLSSKDGVYALVSTYDDDLDANTAPSDSFDLGYLYYYAATYGESIQDGEDLVLDEEVIKEGDEITGDEIRVPDDLVLSVKTFDEDSVTLSWNRLLDGDIDGYEIHYGTQSEDYDDVEEIANAYTTLRTVKGLEEDVLYYLQVIAIDDDGDQVGDASPEVAVIPMEWIFTDVSYLDEHFEAIDSLTDAGIFEGHPDGSFNPNGTINRAELLKTLIEGSGITPSVSTYNNCFPDVNSEWFAPYICYAKINGMIQGYPDGTFRPADVVNKVEALKMLFTVVGEGYENLVEGTTVVSLVYPDLDRTAWYAIYVWRASNLGLLEETPGENFNPTLGRSRGEIAENLYRYLIALESEILVFFE